MDTPTNIIEPKKITPKVSFYSNFWGAAPLTGFYFKD